MTVLPMGQVARNRPIKLNQLIVRSALIAAANTLLAVPAAVAQAVDTSAWECKFCPFESGYRGDYELGASNVSDDSAYFGDATGYDEEGVYANVDGSGSWVGDAHQLRWTIADLGLESRSADLRGGKQGKYDYTLAYSELPRRQYNTTESIFQQTAAGGLSLPSGWVRAPAATGFTQLDSSLGPIDIASDRSVFEIGGRYHATSRFSFAADYRHQEQDGLDIFGGSYFTQASLLPMPVDYVTDEVEIGLRYASDNGFVAFGWYLSDFESGGDAYTWEHPFTSAAGAESASLAQAPDSRFHQASLTGGYVFPAYKTTVNVSAAIGQIEQDENFLPYTSNTNISTTPLPRSSLGGDVDTSNFAVAITSRHVDKVRLKLTYRYDERDNQTPEELWNRVIADSLISGDVETNVPYSFKRSTLRLSADYDLFDKVRVSAGYDRKDFDRDFQEVAEQTEDSGWGRLRWRPNPTIDIDLKGGTSRREVDRYNEAFAITLGQNPLMRKYYLAYRFRQFGEATVTVSPHDGPVSFTFHGMIAEDDYTQSQLGVTGAEELRFNADLNWSVSESASVYLTGGLENIESEQFGGQPSVTPDWQAQNDDNFFTVGGGFRIRQIAEKVDLQMDYMRSDGSSEIQLTSSGELSQFPDLESTLDHVRLKLSYHSSERLELNLNLRYQSFSTEDWTLDGVGPATIPVVLTLGADPYNDDVFVFGLGFRYSMGSGKDASAD